MNQLSPSRPGHRSFIEFQQVIFDKTFPESSQLFNWTIHTDEHWAVVGPAGSGKSLLIDAILKKIPLATGQILYYFNQHQQNNATGQSFFNRNDIIHVSTSNSGLGTEDRTGFYQARWHSMQELDMPVVADYLRPEKSRRISPFEVLPAAAEDSADISEISSIISMMGIENLMARRVQHLSHGELRKVLIARALIQRPKLIILDEPFAGLDAKSQLMFSHVLERLLKSGKTAILLVTSRPEDVPRQISHILCTDENQETVKNPKISQFISLPRRTDIKTSAPPETIYPIPGEDLGKTGCPVIVAMQNTCVAYEGVLILDHINWQVRQGERWALLGPNGAGKSSLLSLVLADNPQAYANNLSLFGKKRGTGETIWEIKRLMGYMSPELQIYYKKNITCLDAVCSGFFDSIGLYGACTRQQIEIAKNWMNIFGIGELENLIFGRLSDSRQRIVMLARALVKSPRLLVLDEPCQGLDRETRQQIIERIDHICRRDNTSLLYVTHDMNELPDVITHVLTLDQGKTTGCGLRERKP